ncbi:MAG: hypothetical protein ACXWTG_08060 [Methylosarcina sp.]
MKSVRIRSGIHTASGSREDDSGGYLIYRSLSCHPAIEPILDLELIHGKPGLPFLHKSNVLSALLLTVNSHREVDI